MSTEQILSSDGLPLEVSLKKAERRNKIRAVLLVAPLFLFVLIILNLVCIDYVFSLFMDAYDKFLDPFKEAIEIGENSNIPIHITHLYQSSYSKGGASKILDLVENTRESGMDITFDSYPYIYGSTRLIIMLPDWTKDGGTKTLKSILASDEMRKKLKSEVSPRALSWEQAVSYTHLTLPTKRIV